MGGKLGDSTGDDDSIEGIILGNFVGTMFGKLLSEPIGGCDGNRERLLEADPLGDMLKKSDGFNLRTIDGLTDRKGVEV